MEKYQRHVSGVEKIVAVIIWAALVLALITQLCYNENVLALIVVLAVCAVTFSWLVFLPEFYELREDSLVIVKSLPSKTVVIPYALILHIDTVGTFRSSKKDLDTVEAIIKYRPQGKKLTRTVSCHPKNILGFVNALKPRCENLVPELEK